MRFMVALTIGYLIPLVPAALAQPKADPDGFDEAAIKSAAAGYEDKRPLAQIRKDNAMIRAASAGDVAAVRKALKEGALINSIYIDGYAIFGSDAGGYTALMKAVWLGEAEVVKLLIAEKANLDAECANPAYRWETALYRAVITDKDAIADLLVKAGAKGDPKQIRLGVEMRRAACKGFELRDGEGYPNHPGNAGGDKKLDIADVLKRGGDINAANPAGYTPLMYAANLGLVENVKTLLARVADATLKTRSGSTALSLTEKESSYAPRERREVVKVLKAHLAMASGANPLGGSWRVVKPMPNPGVEGLIFDREKITIVSKATGNKEFQFKVDAGAKPARIDVFHKDGSKCLGIYEINGGTLRICLGPWLGDRPKDFTAKGKHIALLTLARENK